MDLAEKALSVIEAECVYLWNEGNVKDTMAFVRRISAKMGIVLRA